MAFTQMGPSPPMPSPFTESSSRTWILASVCLQYVPISGFLPFVLCSVCNFYPQRFTWLIANPSREFRCLLLRDVFSDQLIPNQSRFSFFLLLTQTYLTQVYTLTHTHITHSYTHSHSCMHMRTRHSYTPRHAFTHVPCPSQTMYAHTESQAVSLPSTPYATLFFFFLAMTSE